MEEFHAYQPRKHWDRTIPLKSEIQNKRQGTVAADTTAHSIEAVSAMEGRAAAQFRFRILVLDDEPSIREATRDFGKSRL